MKNFALLGRRLSHSYSEELFRQRFADLGIADRYQYRLCEMDTLDGLRQWVEREDISGFNVTVPYKQQIIPLLDSLDATAAAVGAVNCVTRRGSSLIGHNTDAPAFRSTLEEQLRLHDLPRPSLALVLGTGGAARAVAFALGEMGIEWRMVSRQASADTLSYPDLYRRAFPSAIVVNATPLGMYPDIHTSALDLQRMPSKPLFLYDLVYNPSPTLLMQQALELSIPVVDGMPMLRLQAELSWQWFQGV